MHPLRELRRRERPGEGRTSLLCRIAAQFPPIGQANESIECYTLSFLDLPSTSQGSQSDSAVAAADPSLDEGLRPRPRAWPPRPARRAAAGSSVICSRTEWRLGSGISHTAAAAGDRNRLISYSTAASRERLGCFARGEPFGWAALMSGKPPVCRVSPSYSHGRSWFSRR